MSRVKLIEKLKEFKKSSQELNTAWQEEGNGYIGETDYPFEESFDELVLKINAWADEFTELLKDKKN